MKSDIKSILAAALINAVAASLLSGCGGGSGDSSPVTSTQQFPFQTGYKALVANGFSKPFAISGACLGVGAKTVGAAAPGATFDGVAALSYNATLTMSVTNCMPAAVEQTSASYYDSNYVPLGFISAGLVGVYLTPPSIPTSVFVGGTGMIGTENLYTDTTKATSNGTQVLSYVVQADTSSSATIDLITKSYDRSTTLTETEQDYYTMDQSGTLTPVSTDIQYANGSTEHLILTYP